MDCKSLMHRCNIGFIINHITIKWDYLWEKLWTLLIATTNNPSEYIWDEFTKTSKVGPFMESLNADSFQFSARIIKSFVLSS